MLYVEILGSISGTSLFPLHPIKQTKYKKVIYKIFLSGQGGKKNIFELGTNEAALKYHTDL